MTNVKMRPSLFGGYPHEGIKSIEVFPNRIFTDIVDNKVVSEIDQEIYPQIKDVKNTEDMRDFLLDRIHDYNHALNIAENQIRDMRVEYPFQPVDFGFTEITGDNDRYLGGYFKGIYLAVRDSRGTGWVFKNTSSNQETFLNLPNAHIAFITLRAMDIIRDEEFGVPKEIVISEEDKPKTEDLSKTYWDKMAEQRKHNKEYGTGLAVWNEELKSFIIPEADMYPKRLWGLESQTEEFEYPRTPEEIAQIEREEAMNG